MISQSERNGKVIRFSFVEKGGEVGHAWLVLVHNDLHVEPYGLLEDVFVEIPFRGKGIASQLIQEVIARAKQEHCYKIIATSRTERTHVHFLYGRLGFSAHGYEFRMDLL